MAKRARLTGVAKAAGVIALLLAQACAAGGGYTKSASARSAPSMAMEAPSLDSDGQPDAPDESDLRADKKSSADREERYAETVVTASRQTRPGPERAAPMAAPAPPPVNAQGGQGPAQLPKAHEPAKPVPPQDATKPTDTRPVEGPQRPNAPLLIYEAKFRLAVFRTEATLGSIETMARDMGGYLVARTGDTIIVRVPKDRFTEALGVVEKSGDVVSRRVTTQDVTDEFLDLEIRLKNAKAVRDRLQELLAKSNNIQDSLAIERELARLSEQIEQFEGRLKGIRDRVAFSKIEVSVQPRASENLQKNAVRLPFPWMYGLGLSRLLELHE